MTTLVNTREEHLTPQGGHKATLSVYVRNQDGQPVMPCTPAKARKLLRAGKGGGTLPFYDPARVAMRGERSGGHGGH